VGGDGQWGDSKVNQKKSKIGGQHPGEYSRNPLQRRVTLLLSAPNQKTFRKKKALTATKGGRRADMVRRRTPRKKPGEKKKRRQRAREKNALVVKGHPDKP